MRDFVINVILFLCFLAGIGILWNANDELSQTHQWEETKSVRHGLIYKKYKLVKKAGENK